jgi:DNA polymerase I-like protein with 3'-5' exonuclease and polymerase domains
MKLRSMFIAPKGYSFIACDLSQAESWVVSYLSNEATMKNALLTNDIHSVTAAALLLGASNCSHQWNKYTCKLCGIELKETERYIGKQNNHANSYRQSPEQLVRTVNGKSDEPPYLTITLNEARRFNKDWHSLYVGIKLWWRKIENDLQSQQRTLTTPYGRKRTFYQYWGEELFKEATAYIPQSTVGDHALGATQDSLGIIGGILGISKLRDIQTHCKIVQSSHDSVMIECPTTALDDIIPQVYDQFHRPLVINDEMFTIPVDVEYGTRWSEDMQKWKPNVNVKTG